MAPRGSHKAKGKARAKMPTSVMNRHLSLDRDWINGFVSEHIRGLIRIYNVCDVKHERAWDLFYETILLDPVTTRRFSQLQPNTRRATKPAHISVAIGTCRAPNGLSDYAPTASEPSTRVSVHTHRHLPTKCQKLRTFTRNRMGPLATEPSKPRPTKHAHGHDLLCSVHRLHRPTAIYPRGQPAIGPQRPHPNHLRHRKTHV